MIQRKNNNCTPPMRLWRQSLLLPSLTCLGVVSLFSNELVLAQTESSIDTIVPIKEDFNSGAATPAVNTAPPASAARIERLRQKLATSSAPVKPKPQPSVATPPPTRPAQRTRIQTAIAPTKPIQKTATTPDAGGTYIDPTNYSIGATRGYEPPSAVVLSERSTGCKAVLRSGQGASRACRTAPPAPRTRIAINTPQSRRSLTQVPDWAKTRMTTVAAVAPVNGGANVTKNNYSTSKKPPAYIQGAIALANKSLNASTLAYSNRTLRSEGQIQAPTGLLFPLALPAPITSLFGWRIHPISGDRRLHTGTDLGAPMGTPVLAAHEGKVAIANVLGGYGLTVVLEHNPLTKQAPKMLTSTLPQQTLYGHLSEIFVQPGETVTQGTVIGRVGSTGNSTGPHLHFETRHLTPDGWVATDPGIQLEYALTQLVEALKTARAPQERG